MAALAEYFLATENVTQRPAALASLEGLLETQHLEIYRDILNQNLHFNSHHPGYSYAN